MILRKYGAIFKKWKQSQSGKNDIQIHKDHEKYIKLKLSSENLSGITRTEFTELYKHLWASEFWINKDWKVNKILDENCLANLINELSFLLYGSEPFEKRYNLFRKKVKGFGISTISEILSMIYPEKFCVWNNKTKSVLKFLNLKNNLTYTVFKNNSITGEEYSICINYMSMVKNELYPYHVNDFIYLNVFFWYIHKYIISKNQKVEKSI
ncbi:MAG: hypothetical protein ACPKQO_00590 [Nitrososphaeraceae archaeon]